MSTKQHHHFQAPKTQDFMVWRVLKDRRQNRDEEIRHQFNLRRRPALKTRVH